VTWREFTPWNAEWQELTQPAFEEGRYEERHRGTQIIHTAHDADVGKLRLRL